MAEQLEQTLRQAGQESGLQVGLTGYGQLALDSAEDTEARASWPRP